MKTHDYRPGARLDSLLCGLLVAAFTILPLSLALSSYLDAGSL
jgi:hypothetical protein